jgi:hypothetical protein
MYPHERSLVKTLADKPFAILGINSDTDRDELKKVIAKEEITWRSWWDGGSTNGPIATTWNVYAWPTLYLIDAKGVIRYKGDHLRSVTIREKDGKRQQVNLMDEAIDTLLREAEAKPK